MQPPSRTSTPVPTTESTNENTNHDDYPRNTAVNVSNDTKTDNGENANDSIESNCTDEVHFFELKFN